MATQVTNNFPSRPKPQKLSAPKTAPPKGVTKLNKAPGVGQAGGALNGVAGQATGAIGQAAQNLPIPSAYEIMAGRIANRVAEMAENITFVERSKQDPAAALQETDPATGKKRPRKLDIRLGTSTKGDVSFSPAFLDNLLGKMLTLQARMLKVSNELGGATDVEEETKKEQYEQTSELSRIVALICAEKARQGA